MSDERKELHRETLERYCHVIGKNTAFRKSFFDGETVYDCMNRHICEKNGGCKNTKITGNKMH